MQNRSRMPPSRTHDDASMERAGEVVLTSWLHLSDIHFGHGSAGHQWDQQLVAGDLRRDIRETAQSGALPSPERIFVTGDVAFSGGGRRPVAGTCEYDLARRWLEDVAADLGLGHEQVFVVPGNHDVNREVDTVDREISRLVRGAREGLEALDDLLQHVDDADRLRRRMSRYIEFARIFGQSDREEYLGGLWWRHRVPLVDGVSLRICGVNTALLSVDDDDQGRLRMGNRQLADLLIPSPAELELVVILSHHPLTGKWLADEGTVRGRFDREATLHLFGHLHEADSEQARHGWGAGCLRVAAGASHAEAEVHGRPHVGHGYNFGALILLPDGGLVIRLWPRRWSSRSTRFVPDTDNIDEYKGYAEHALRHRVPRQPLRPLIVGALLGERYRLLEVLGEGGVGQVWKAEDTVGDDGLVAVKVLNPDGRPSPAGRRETFYRGACEMARVRHPGIVRILHLGPSLEGATRRHDFYAMELVDGQNLYQAFRARRCDERRTIEVLLAIIDAVAAAHAQKVVHRDLKPSNVLLRRDGSIKLVDFDTAKDLHDATRTRTGGHLLSDLYASPEVLDGGVIDERADIYSITATGIFLLRGEDPPISAINRMSELAEIVGCSSGLREVLRKGCAHDPENRYGAIGELRAALACTTNSVSAADEAPRTVAGTTRPAHVDAQTQVTKPIPSEKDITGHDDLRPPHKAASTPRFLFVSIGALTLLVGTLWYSLARIEDIPESTEETRHTPSDAAPPKEPQTAPLTPPEKVFLTSPYGGTTSLSTEPGATDDESWPKRVLAVLNTIEIPHQVAHRNTGAFQFRIEICADGMISRVATKRPTGDAALDKMLVSALIGMKIPPPPADVADQLKDGCKKIPYTFTWNGDGLFE